ncbi:hypothetical protein ABK040_001252 [Willaertia magna]
MDKSVKATHLSWGNVPTVNNNNKKPNNNKTNRSTTKSLKSLKNENNKIDVDDFVQRVTTLSKDVEQLKQLSNQRAQQVALSDFQISSSYAPSSTTWLPSPQLGITSSSASSDSLRGNQDLQKRIRSLRQTCTTEANELKKLSTLIANQFASENNKQLLLESNTINTAEEVQRENIIKFNRVKNDLIKTIDELKNLIRRDREFVVKQAKLKQEQLGTAGKDLWRDEEEEIESEDHPLLHSSPSIGSSSKHHQQQELLEKEEHNLVSWQDSTLQVEKKIALEEYEDLIYYQKEAVELNYLVTEFAQLVDQQDPLLDSIHSNVITSKDNVERGVEHLIASNKLQRYQRYSMCLIIGVVLIAIIAIVLIILFGGGIV